MKITFCCSQYSENWGFSSKFKLEPDTNNIHKFLKIQTVHISLV